MPDYYAYYNAETGDVTGISNIPRSTGSMLVIPESVALPFLEGKYSFINSRVSAVTKDDRTTLELVQKQYAASAPVVVVFDAVSKFTDTHDLLIDYNLIHRKWIITLIRPSDVIEREQNIALFVVKECNHNEIVSMLQIPVAELLANSKVEIPFEDELQINDLTILTKLVPNSYKLVITHD